MIVAIAYRASLFVMLMTIGTVSSTPSLAQSDWISKAIGKRPTTESRHAQTPVAPAFASRNLLISRATLSNIDRTLARYDQLAARKSWTGIPKGRALRLGDQGSRVRLLVQRLVATGDLAPQAAARVRDSFDGQVKNALQRFQIRHGLTPSGRVNSYTRSALNASAKQRRDQLVQNRQRIAELLARTEGR